jgi:Protein of unknown function (DUF4079)
MRFVVQSGLKADLSKLQSAAVIKIDEEFAAITKRRKDLSTKNVRDKHYEMGSLILGLGVFAAIEGPANTYVRAGKVRQTFATAQRELHICVMPLYCNVTFVVRTAYCTGHDSCSHMHTS